MTPNQITGAGERSGFATRRSRFGAQLTAYSNENH
jgi:hypothetical protein